jgi:hypothetical protein
MVSRGGRRRALGFGRTNPRTIWDGRRGFWSRSPADPSQALAKRILGPHSSRPVSSSSSPMTRPSKAAWRGSAPPFPPRERVREKVETDPRVNLCDEHNFQGLHSQKETELAVAEDRFSLYRSATLRQRLGGYTRRVRSRAPSGRKITNPTKRQKNSTTKGVPERVFEPLFHGLGGYCRGSIL